MPWAPRRTKKLQNYRCWQEVLKLEGRKFIWRRWEVWIIQHLCAHKTASGQEEPGSPGTWQTIQGHPGCVCREWTAKVWDEVEVKRQKCPAPRSPRQLHKHLSDWNPPKGEQGGRQKKIPRGSNLNVTELQTGTCQEVSELDWVYTEMTQLKTFCCVRNYIYCKKIRQFCTSECVTGKEKAISWALFTLFSSSGQGPSFHWGQAKSMATPWELPLEPLQWEMAQLRPPAEAGVSVHSVIHLHAQQLSSLCSTPLSLEFWIRQPRRSLGSQEQPHQTFL